jgi:hypothetical protein
VFAYGYQERENTTGNKTGTGEGKRERKRNCLSVIKHPRMLGKRGAASEFGVAKIEQHCDGNVTMLTACW